MSVGPGIYDKEALLIMERTNAVSVVLIVIGGDRGEGFSATSVDPAFPQYIPTLLRDVAAEIEPTVAANVLQALKDLARGEDGSPPSPAEGG